MKASDVYHMITRRELGSVQQLHWVAKIIRKVRNEGVDTRMVG